MILPPAAENAILTAGTGLEVLRVTGEDATRFLDAQVTAALGEDPGTASFAAIADPKGRVRITFHAWHTEDAWQLALAAGEIEWLREYLARFVFRARVGIAADPDTHLLGVSGAKATAALSAVGLTAPAPHRTASCGALTAIGLAHGRWLLAGPSAALADVEQRLGERTRSGNFEDWKHARLAAGEVEIRAASRDRFLPQMLGLVELGAVSFRKGCYPGQEVIARLQHRGRVKRTLALFRLDAPLEAGSFHELEGIRVEVLDSVALPDGGELVQVVAPHPLPPELEAHRYSEQI
ncbi:MAG: YgfZ/GcvT domain-containing protein [Gammaproteobacteria bacterium]